MKANGKELGKLYDVCRHHIRGIELFEHFDLDTLPTIVMELKLVKR